MTRRPRPPLDALLLAAAVLGGGVAVALLRQPWARASGSPYPWELLIAAAAVGALALRSADAWLPDAAPGPVPAAPTSARRRIAARWMLAAAGTLTVAVAVRLWPDYHVWQGTVIPWIAALALTGVAGLLLGETAPGPAMAAPSPPAPELPRRLELALFLAIAAGALAVRVWHIGSIPSGIYVDETNGGLDALYLLEGRGDSPFGTGWYGTPTGYVYYMALVFKLFGATWAGLKTASLLPAVLTVLAIYPLARLMFGQVGGLSTMAFLAFNRWHMSMSRWGWNEVVPPLFQILATFFLLRGLRDRRSSDFALGGLISGLMMYTYLSSRLALATLGLSAVYCLAVARDGPFAAWRRHWRGLLLFLFGWAVAVAPIAVTHITDPFTFFNRVNEISVFKDIRERGSYEPLRRNVIDHLKFFHQTGDHQSKHNLPEEPEADPVVGLLFIVGLAYAVLRPRDGRSGLLWLWLLLGMAGGVFSSNHESPQSYRTLTAAPAIALLAGDVLARTARVWAGALAGTGAAARRRRAVAGAAVVVAGCGFTAVWECRAYFVRQAGSIAVRAAYNPTENGVAREVLDALAKGESVFVSPRFYGFAPLRFLVYGQVKRATGRNTLDDPPYMEVALDNDLPVPDTGSETLLLLENYYLPLADYIRLFYPSAVIEPVRSLDGVPIYLRVRLTRQEVSATTGVAVRVVEPDGVVREGVARTPDVAEVPSGAVRIDVTGSVRVEAGGVYDLWVPAGFELALDGSRWNGPRHLGRGLHALAIASSAPGAARAPTLEWSTPGHARATVPASALFRIRPPNLGLTTYYWANRDWHGPPLFRTLTPILFLAWMERDPVFGAFSARFVGALRIDRAGAYRFSIVADDEATLYLDGKRVGRSVINKASDFPVTVRLSAGDHPIQIDYVQLGGGSALEVFWEPPGRPEELIPPQSLIPQPADGGGTR